jgi:hypothetical protein
MRSYYIILFRYGKDHPWQVYHGERGGLAPSLFLKREDARLEMKTLRPFYPYFERGLSKIVRLFERENES